MVTKILIVGTFTILITSNLYSQKKTFPGYYINSKGDTINGLFPKYNQWLKNPTIVDFTPSNTTETLQLTPANCNKFYVENYDTYFGFNGYRIVNPIEFDQAVNLKDSFGLGDKSVPVSAFLRLVARTGNCEIYMLTDDIRTNFFYRLNSDPLQELRYKMYFEQNNVHEIFDYRQQLNAIFSKEIEKRKIEAGLETLQYTEESFSELLEKLTPENRRKIKERNAADGVIFGVGASLNFFKVTGDKTTNEVNLKYKASISPLLTIGYLSTFSRNFGRYFIYPHLNLFNYKNTGESSDATFSRTVTFKAAVAALPAINLGVNVINSARHRVFISAGGGILFLAKNVEETKMIGSGNNQQYLSSTIDLSYLSLNVNACAGVTINSRLTASATYNVPATVANFVYYNPYLSCLQIVFAYRL